MSRRCGPRTARGSTRRGRSVSASATKKKFTPDKAHSFLVWPSPETERVFSLARMRINVSVASGGDSYDKDFFSETNWQEMNRTGRKRMVNLYIYLTVIVSGASVLAIELLGTRIIAPFYGASLYLWSALISVTLAALSVGYAIGGRWADRGPTLVRFCTIVGLAGLWIALIPWLKGPALGITQALGLRAAVLVTATVLFFPPLALLGMISPYAIRLKAASLDVVGTTAGNLYAVSTVASVVAALLTGFFLIPHVGVYRLVFSIGLVLIITAIVGLYGYRRLVALFGLPLALILAVLFMGAASPVESADPDDGILAIVPSEYAEIRVVDYDSTRYMLIDGGAHTIADVATWESYLPYVNVLDIAKRFFTEPGNMLLVGVGGGSVIKSFARDGWRVDAVEIDPAVTQIARKYFDLSDDDPKIYTMDGRRFLITHQDRYRLIIMDAFGSSSIPFHLVTKESFALIKSHLSEDGVLAMNVEAVGWDDPIVRALAVTAEQVFAHVTVLPIAEPPNQLGNLVLFASDRELTLTKDLPVPGYRFSAAYDRAHAWDNRFEVKPGDGQVLTDDLNPIDVWSERVNLVARRQLHAFFKKAGIPTW
ncbi:MAG: hypothetical protein D6800_05235 [Candidatus Zixiibacteriota bacterium]|nr:MAG: hypothetical protein D6800_05235 [candidate division Zixibacteria bacterium]